MATVLLKNDEGGFAYLPWRFAFASEGVIALTGMTIERAVLPVPSLLPEGFDAVPRYLERIGRPLAALCGFELRVPQAMSVEDFFEFNDRHYMGALEKWGVLRDGASPACRTNVSPVTGGPSGPALLAFSYTVPTESSAPSFLISGLPELRANFTHKDDIVRLNETSDDALAEKTAHVVNAVRERIAELGTTWDDACSVHLYSAHPLADVLRRRLVDAGISPAHGIIWHPAAPPTTNLALEVDVRRYSREVTITE